MNSYFLYLEGTLAPKRESQLHMQIGHTNMASISSSPPEFLSSLRVRFSAAFAVFFSVFSFPFPGFLTFFPIRLNAQEAVTSANRLNISCLMIVLTFCCVRMCPQGFGMRAVDGS